MVIKAIVADDQAILRTAFSNLLNTQDDIEVVGEAEDGAQAVQLATRYRPDVALLDIRMPHKNGIEAAREIVSASKGATKALMLTTFSLDEYVYAALEAGASGFLLKDATFPELLQAVRVVAAGEALLAPSVTKRLIAEFGRRGARPQAGVHEVEGLTGREVDVLVLIGQGLSNADIAARLCISDHTVKTHINRLFAKMGLTGRAQAVILAYELGLVVAGAARTDSPQPARGGG
ncbi:response regulator transcription factor [Streptomyces cremeus]|uniref:Response regulator n=1 Tax=Streptomyces cremeus TaxID=66881 RepID=A0ABV5PP67_STRCM